MRGDRNSDFELYQFANSYFGEASDLMISLDLQISQVTLHKMICTRHK